MSRLRVEALPGDEALFALGVPVGPGSVAQAVVAGDTGMSLGVTGNATRLSWPSPLPAQFG